jgi:hypothetical protein
VVEQGLRVLRTVGEIRKLHFTLDEELIGGIAIDKTGNLGRRKEREYFGLKRILKAHLIYANEYHCVQRRGQREDK